MTAPVASMRRRAPRRFQLIVAASVLAAALGVLVGTGRTSNELTLEGIGDGPIKSGPRGAGITDGGVASNGQFTVAGVIQDKGTYTDYRSVTGRTATVRKVLVGTKGTITIVITIHLGSEVPAPWRIASGSRSYAGLHGKGTLTVDDYQDDPYTFAMAGTAWR